MTRGPRRPRSRGPSTSPGTSPAFTERSRPPHQAFGRRGAKRGGPTQPWLTEPRSGGDCGPRLDTASQGRGGEAAEDRARGCGPRLPGTWRNAVGTEARRRPSCPNTERLRVRGARRARQGSSPVCRFRGETPFSRCLWRGGQTHVTRPELSAHPAGHRVPPTAAPPPLTHEASPAVPVRPTPRRNPEGSLGASAPAPGHRALQRPCGHKPRSRRVPTGPTGHASGLVLRGRRAVLPVDTRTRHEAASGRMQGGPRQRPLPRDTCACATHHDPRGPGPGAGAGAGRRQSTAWCGRDGQPLRSAGAVPG